MTPDAYCAAQVRVYAPAIYYSLLFAPNAMRSPATALFAWDVALQEIAARTTHGEVAVAKFGWWRQELSATFAGEPHHPCMRALVPAIATGDVTHAALFGILGAVERRLYATQADTFSELRLRCLADTGAVSALAAKMFGARTRQAQTSAEIFGLGFALTDMIQNSSNQFRHGRILFPREDCARHDIAAAIPQTSQQPASMRALIAEQVARTKTIFAQADAMLPNECRRSLRMHIVRAHLAQTLLAEIARRDFDVLSQRIELPALRHLWRAWRGARAEAKRLAAHE